MTESLEIVERPEERLLRVRARVPVPCMPRVMGQVYRRILDHLEACGAAPAGPPVCRYTGFDWDELLRESRLTTLLRTFTRKWELELGIPVSGAVKAGEEMEAAVIAGGRYLQTLHRGPYRKVGETYRRLQDHVRDEGLAVRNESVEIYLNDPRTTPMDELETLVLIPLDE